MKKIKIISTIFLVSFLSTQNVFAFDSFKTIKWVDPDKGFNFMHNDQFKNAYELQRPCPSKKYEQCKKDDTTKIYQNFLTDIQKECKGDTGCINEETKKWDILSESLIDICEYNVELCATGSDKNDLLVKNRSEFKYSGNKESDALNNYIKETYFSFTYRITNTGKTVFYDSNSYEDAIYAEHGRLVPKQTYYVKAGKLIRKLDYSEDIKRLQEIYPNTIQDISKVKLITVKPFLKNKNGVIFYKVGNHRQNYNNVYCAIANKYSVCFLPNSESHPQAIGRDEEDAEVITDEKYLIGNIIPSFSFSKKSKRILE